MSCPGSELRDKMNRHFWSLVASVTKVYLETNDLKLGMMFSNLTQLGNAFDDWQDATERTRAFQILIRQTTFYLMNMGIPALHSIDPEVAEFVWTEKA